MLSRSAVSNFLPPHGLYSPPSSSVHGILQARTLEWVALLQGIFPTQGSNTGLQPCRQILYPLSYQGRGTPKKGVLDVFFPRGENVLSYCRIKNTILNTKPGILTPSFSLPPSTLFPSHPLPLTLFLSSPISPCVILFCSLLPFLSPAPFLPVSVSLPSSQLPFLCTQISSLGAPSCLVNLFQQLLGIITCPDTWWGR